MTKYAIIVAGGSGSRFGSTIPKQFLLLDKKPVLMHAIQAFHDYDPEIRIIVALPSEYISLWSDLCRQHRFQTGHSVAEGGSSRFESVKNALTLISETDGIVAIHDGARPLISIETIRNGFDTAERCGTAVPVIPVSDTIRQLDRQGSHTLDRETLVAVQTPQVFNTGLLKEAYTAAYSPLFTDDASVVEYRGIPVTLYSGSVKNIKITHPGDIRIAEQILNDGNA